MAGLLLDTTFLIDVLNDRRGRADLMERMIGEQYTLCCCPINVAEVYAGLRHPEAQKTETLLRQLAYVPISWETAKLDRRLEAGLGAERADAHSDRYYGSRRCA